MYINITYLCKNIVTDDLWALRGSRWQEVKIPFYFFNVLLLNLVFQAKLHLNFKRSICSLRIVDAVLLFWNLCPVNVCVFVCVWWAWKGKAAAGKLLTVHTQQHRCEQRGFSGCCSYTSNYLFYFCFVLGKKTFLVRKLFICGIDHADLEFRMRILAEGLEWSWVATGQRSCRRRVFFPRSERCKFCCWSSCFCRHGCTQWVPWILILYHKKCMMWKCWSTSSPDNVDEDNFR